MDYNYPELNPVVILRLSYRHPKEEILGAVYLRKLSVEKFKSNVKTLLSNKFDLVELSPRSNFIYNLQKSNSYTDMESDVSFMFIPFVFNQTTQLFIKGLNCVEYENDKGITNAEELFSKIEFDMITAVQVKGEIVEPNIVISEHGKADMIVDIEEDLKTVEGILSKYELKLTAEQKCKFIEELVKVLG